MQTVVFGKIKVINIFAKGLLTDYKQINFFILGKGVNLLDFPQ